MWIASCCIALLPALSQDPPPPDNQDRVCERLLAASAENPALDLWEGRHKPSGTRFVQGFYDVFENRSAGTGRKIRIGVIVLPARAEKPEPDPVFLLHGGPGAGAIKFLPRQWKGWLRERRDVVLIDQRGTGHSNALQVPVGGTDDDLQTYLETFYQPERFAAALPELQERADLTQYTTDNSVDDFDEIRAALGYDKINLRGGSYGTRSALVYMRRHPDTIRTATLQGVQPISYRNPLPHARGAQESLELIFEEIRATPRYREAFPDIEARFAETLARLEKEPARVTVSHPKSGAEQEVVLDRATFAEAVRMQLYQIPTNRRLPLLLTQAHAGDYRALTQALIRSNRGVGNAIAWGMLMCVTGSEDLCRIDEEEIGPACAGTFLGETRIRRQLAVYAIWPCGRVDEEFAEPVSVDVPTLFLSGTHDPSTSPKWGADAARHMPASLHVVMPSGHGVFGPEVERLQQAFLESGTVEGLDLTEIEALEWPPLVLPGANR